MPPRNRKKGNKAVGEQGGPVQDGHHGGQQSLSCRTHRATRRHWDPGPVGVGSPEGFKQKVLWVMFIFRSSPSWLVRRRRHMCHGRRGVSRAPVSGALPAEMSQ